MAVSVAVGAALPAAPATASPEGVMFTKINQVRHANGLARLRPSFALFYSSKRYARRMIRTDYFGHQARIPHSSKAITPSTTSSLAPCRLMSRQPIRGHSGNESITVQGSTSTVSAQTARGVFEGQVVQKLGAWKFLSSPGGTDKGEMKSNSGDA